MSQPRITPDSLKKMTPAAFNALGRDVFRIRAERSLVQFTRQAWNVIDPAEFVDGWHLHAIAEHLEAVSRGEIRRLLINIPPRHCKSLLVSVCWPAWVWAKERKDYTISGPKTKFMCLSYADSLALDHARLMRKLIASEWYQGNWGDRVKLSGDQDAKENFDNTAGGVRLSGGINGTITGRGADVKIIDDPHKVKEVESDVVRQGVINTYDETLRNRVTSPKTSAEVIVMQRIGEGDLSGHVLDKGDVIHLMLPAKFERDRKCYTVLGWEDPRQQDGEILWPEQWGEAELAPFELNEYQWAGQYQQSPAPRGGGIIKRDWWKVWPPEGEEDAWQQKFDVEDPTTGEVNTVLRNVFPPFEFIIASCDTAYTEKQENDFSACVVLGLFRDRRNYPQIMLINAWQDRLELNALVHRILRTCEKRGCDAVVVEAKASGKSVVQEIKRLMQPGAFNVHEFEPGGDKVARMYAVQPLFSAKKSPASPSGSASIVYAPDTTWAQMVIDQLAVFPKGSHDDLADALAQGLQFLRKRGLAQLPHEAEEDDIRSKMFRAKAEDVRDQYGV